MITNYYDLSLGLLFYMDNEDNKIPSGRAKDILSVIINKYIAEGVPIGSKNL